MERESAVASDGLVARVTGDYARKKLAFIQFFCPPAIDATEKKRRRVYVDLFAGPGINLIRRSGEEVESGALTALRSTGQRRRDLSFTDAHLVNLDHQDHKALRQRVDKLVAEGQCVVPSSCIRHEHGDANSLVQRLLANCHQEDYLLVFADIEAPRQLPWATVEALGSMGHKSVDLYLLFPLEMGLNRLTSYKEMSQKNADIITAFFGDQSWRPILDQRITEAQGPECKRRLEALYLQKLGALWEKAEKVMDVQLSGRQGLYRMLFATNHAAGAKIAEWAKRQAAGTDQLGFKL